MQRLYDKGELGRWLRKKRDIYYVPILAFNDVTKFEAVRNCSYEDACTAQIAILDSR